MEEQIILVDEQDQQIGTEGKLKTHQDGALHRAYSIYIFNDQNELMLQQRAKDKYHCGGLWTNTTCSHPRADEDLVNSAHRRLKEEMGFDTEVKKIGEYIYKVSFDNGLTEHEYIHVFIGRYNQEPHLNLAEAMNWKWMKIEDLEKAIEEDPNSYTYWMKKALPLVKEALKTL